MQYIAGGDIAFNALIYPEQNQNNAGYFMRAMSKSVDHLVGAGREMYEYAKNAYSVATSSYNLEIARNALRAAGQVFHPNQINYLHELSAMQTTTGVMRRWITACPEVMELHRAQRCSSWDNTYKDWMPSVDPLDHPDYKQVMSGLMMEQDVDGQYRWSVNSFDVFMPDGDTKLSQSQRLDIRDTWDIVRSFIEAGSDVSSPFDSPL